MTNSPYRGSWRRSAEKVLKAHRARFGDYCPGWRVAPHRAVDLVVDHDVGPLCRRCNGSKAAIEDKARARARRRQPTIRRGAW
jgi:hypothetical protein